MITLSLLSHILVASLVLHGCKAASYLNGSSTSLASTTPRRLRSMVEIDKVCTIAGQRIKGIEYLEGNVPFRTGSYLAMCNEDPEDPSLTCFMDDGVADSKAPMHDVECTEVAEEQKRRRRLAAYDKHIKDATLRSFGGGTWPGGVVCYTLAKKWTSPTEFDETHDAKMDDFFKKHVQTVFEAYEKAAAPNLKFIDITACKEADSVCNGCKHAVMIDAPDDMRCESSVGFNVPAVTTKGQLKRQKTLQAMFRLYIDTNQEQLTSDMTFQPLVLGSEEPGDPYVSCQHPSSIYHEVGHTLGLHHDHSLQARKANVFLNIEELDPDNDVDRLKRLRAELQAATTDEEKLELKAARKNLRGHIVRWKNNFNVQDCLVGTYDIKSIMHYSHHFYFCIQDKLPAKNQLRLKTSVSMARSTTRSVSKWSRQIATLKKQKKCGTFKVEWRPLATSRRSRRCTLPPANQRPKLCSSLL